MKSTYTLTGANAIRIAERDSITLRKHADPIEGARAVSLKEAQEIAKEDPSLIFAEVVATGWTNDPDFADSPDLAVVDMTPDVLAGYDVGCYFRSGEYLGADQHGIEPTFANA